MVELSLFYDVQCTLMSLPVHLHSHACVRFVSCTRAWWATTPRTHRCHNYSYSDKHIIDIATNSALQKILVSGFEAWIYAGYKLIWKVLKSKFDWRYWNKLSGWEEKNQCMLDLSYIKMSIGQMIAALLIVDAMQALL